MKTTVTFGPDEEERKEQQRLVEGAQKELLNFLNKPYSEKNIKAVDDLLEKFMDRKLQAIRVYNFNKHEPACMICGHTEHRVTNILQLQTLEKYISKTSIEDFEMDEYIKWHADEEFIFKNQPKEYFNFLLNILATYPDILKPKNGHGGIRKLKNYMDEISQFEYLTLKKLKYDKKRENVEKNEIFFYHQLLKNPVIQKAHKIDLVIGLLEADMWVSALKELQCIDNKNLIANKEQIVQSVFNGYHQGGGGGHQGIHDKAPNCAYPIVDQLIERGVFQNFKDLETHQYYGSGYNYTSYSYNYVFHHPCFMSDKMAVLLKNEIINDPLILNKLVGVISNEAEDVKKVFKCFNDAELLQLEPHFLDSKKRFDNSIFHGSFEKRKTLEKYIVLVEKIKLEAKNQNAVKPKIL